MPRQAQHGSLPQSAVSADCLTEEKVLAYCNAIAKRHPSPLAVDSAAHLYACPRCYGMLAQTLSSHALTLARLHAKIAGSTPPELAAAATQRSAHRRLYFNPALAWSLLAIACISVVLAFHFAQPKPKVADLQAQHGSAPQQVSQVVPRSLAIDWRMISAAYAAEPEARYLFQRLSLKKDGAQPLPAADTALAQLMAALGRNSSIRAYGLPDGRVLVAVLLGGRVDGYLFEEVTSGGMRLVREPWTIDLQEQALALTAQADPASEDLARAYFKYEDTLSASYGGKDWAEFTPAAHAILHDTADVNGDGAPELPVSLNGLLFLISPVDGQVVREWATAPAKYALLHYVYAPIRCYDLLPSAAGLEVIVPLATAYAAAQNKDDWRQRRLPLNADEDPVSWRGLQVYSSTGKLLSELEWPNYPKPEPVILQANGKPGLYLSGDSAGNTGYDVPCDIHGQHFDLTDSELVQGFIEFSGAEPRLTWISKLDAGKALPASSAGVPIEATIAGGQFTELVHHAGTPADPQVATMLLSFRPDEARLVNLGSYQASLGRPSWGPVVVSAADLGLGSDSATPLLLATKPAEPAIVPGTSTPAATAHSTAPSLMLLKPDNGSLTQLAAAPLQAWTTPARQGLGILPPKAGHVPLVVWGGGAPRSFAVMEATGGALVEPQSETTAKGRILDLLPIVLSDGHVILLAITDSRDVFEFWKLNY